MGRVIGFCISRHECHGDSSSVTPRLGSQTTWQCASLVRSCTYFKFTPLSCPHYCSLFFLTVSQLHSDSRVMQSLPSPAESPSLKPQQDQLPSNRKRQRSQSMQSDASSSSAKRSQSEGASNDNAIRSSLADNTSSQTITEIDAYMAEQGEDTIQLPEPVLSQNGTSPSMPPPMKFAKIKELRTQPMVIGDTWYIVARQWLRRWEKACSGEVDKEGGVDESALGPINNSSLFDKDGNVTSTLLEGIDVDFLPKEAWALFVTWCVQLLAYAFQAGRII